MSYQKIVFNFILNSTMIPRSNQERLSKQIQPEYKSPQTTTLIASINKQTEHIMKKSTFLKVLLTFLFVSTVMAQVPDDPFDGYYSTRKSAEAYLFEIVNNEEVSLQAFDFDINNYTINQWDKESTPVPVDFHWSCIDVVSADLDGDSKDEIVSVMFAKEQKVQIVLNRVINQQIQPGSQILPPFNCIMDKEMATTQLIVGNFVPDAKDEVAIAYMGTDNKFYVKIYQAQGVHMKLQLVSESFGIDVAGKERDNYEYDYTGDQFDITAIDYDQDGTDEIFMVHKLDFDHNTRQFYFRAISFDNSMDNPKKLDTTVSNIGNILLDYGNAQGYYTHRISRISRPSLASGNVDGKAENEIVFGYIVSTRHDGFLTSVKSELNTVQILRVNPMGKIDFYNKPTLIGSYVQNNLKKNWSRHHFSMAVECADFDNDGIDEIVCNSPDSLHMLSYGWLTNKLQKTTGIHCNDNRFYEHRAPSFAIADVNIDTTSSEWTKEIVYMQYSSNRGDISLRIATLDNGHLIEKDALLIQHESYAKKNELRYILTLGDFDGDGLRLGEPEKLPTIEDVLEPRVIINAPPVHYDIFDSVEYDICSAFDGSPEFISYYTKATNVTNDLLIQNVTDWSISLGGNYEANAFYNLNTSFLGQHGKYFEDSELITESISEISSFEASINDRYFISKTNYHFYEYPVYLGDDVIKYVLVQYPELTEEYWKTGKSNQTKNIISNHEIGNILSYSRLDDMRDRDSLNIAGDPYEIINDKGSWQLDLTNTTKTSFFTKTYNNNSWELNINLKATLDLYGLQLGGGIGFQSKGQYDTQTIKSTAITTGRRTNVRVEYGKIANSYYSYTITPYVYYSSDGVFVLDYIAEPLALAIGTAKDSTWWDRHYSSHPDLAFILPWKYDREKFNINISDQVRTQTKDLIFVPRHPAPGDTVSIVTRIHNYSLKDLNESVSIQYFLGDPDNGGELMNVLYEGLETSEIVLSADLPERDEMAFKAEWIIPLNIDYQPRIYAVIDPGNEITEIHENNNKGNAVLEIKDKPTSVEDHSNIVPINFSLEQNYPNPFNPSTQIEFTIPKAEIVKVEIFDILGQKVKTLLHKKRNAGSHKIKFSANHLSSGVYFYKITAGEFIKIKKMLFLK